MNVLVFDAPVCVAHVVKSILLARGHRAAVVGEAEEGARMLTTSLFDALVIGPCGVPEEFANFVQEEFPQLPIVLAGVPVFIPPAGQIAAVLPAPLSARKLVSAVVRLERERHDRVSRLPVSIATDGAAIACRLADLTLDTLQICGESDEFNRYFDASPSRLEAVVAGTPLGGLITASEVEGPLRIRRVAVKLDGERAREVLVQLLKA